MYPYQLTEKESVMSLILSILGSPDSSPDAENGRIYPVPEESLYYITNGATGSRTPECFAGVGERHWKRCDIIA